MKLRDKIALEAMKLNMAAQYQQFGAEYDEDGSNDKENREYAEAIARGAYMMADAMMAVRDEVV